MKQSKINHFFAKAPSKKPPLKKKEPYHKRGLSYIIQKKKITRLELTYKMIRYYILVDGSFSNYVLNYSDPFIHRNRLASITGLNKNTYKNGKHHWQTIVVFQAEHLHHCAPSQSTWKGQSKQEVTVSGCLGSDLDRLNMVIRTPILPHISRKHLYLIH